MKSRSVPSKPQNGGTEMALRKHEGRKDKVRTATKGTISKRFPELHNRAVVSAYPDNLMSPRGKTEKREGLAVPCLGYKNYDYDITSTPQF